jgi:hypothetical protein
VLRKAAVPERELRLFWYDHRLLLYVTRGLVNNGTLKQNSTGSTKDLVFTGRGTVTVSASGAITVSNNSNNRISAASAGITLQNSGSISSAGVFNADYGNAFNVVNGGTILANQATRVARCRWF